MKKTIVLMLMTALLVLAGCGGNDEKVISGEVANVETDDAQTVEAEDTSDKNATTDGYVFESNGVSISVDGEAEAYISGLGEPLSYFESPSCAFGDLDKIYTYSGFELDTYSLEGVDYVSAVIFKDDSVSTPEGISIGDSVDKVKEIYGEPESEESTIISYVKGKTKLCFLVQDGSVVSVEYRTMILDM